MFMPRLQGHSLYKCFNKQRGLNSYRPTVGNAHILIHFVHDILNTSWNAPQNVATLYTKPTKPE